MTYKTQMEITNVMFMHLIGFIGIMAFTFLFISLMTGSEARASGLKEETLYQNYGRRLISSADCLAQDYLEIYYDGSSAQVQSFSRISPGVVNMGKFFDFNHQNCLRYDLVSGAINNDPRSQKQSFPAILYEVTAYDLDEELEYEFTSAMFKSKGLAVKNKICLPKSGGYPHNCLFDCDDVRTFLNNATLQQIYNDTNSLIDTVLEGRSIEGMTPDEKPDYVIPGGNCWENDFNDALRAVVPYTGLKCSSIPKGVSYEFGFGNVFETGMQYYVKLRYDMKDGTVVMNDGVLDVKFCVINIPTMCDPAFAVTDLTSALNDLIILLSIKGINTNKVYQEKICKFLGLPLI